MKLFGWTGGDDGLAHIRVRVPFDALAERGHEVHHGLRFQREHGDADTIVGCRIALPEPSRLWTHACGMLGGPFCVFETDDDNLHLSKWNPAKRFWDRPEVRFFHLSNMRVAHRLVTSTPYLQQLLYDQSGHPDIVVAPNSLPGWVRELPRRDHEAVQERGPVVIGWAGGSSHAGDWEWVKQAVRKALVTLPKSAPPVILRFVGHDFRSAMRLPDDRMEHVRWFDSVEDYWRDGLDFDIGLAPLRPESFNRAKSPIKPLEYGARGIPTIASDYGPYADYVGDDFTGLLCKKPRDWIDAIHMLVQDPWLRQRYGLNGWAQSKALTIEHTWPKFLEAYTP